MLDIKLLQKNIEYVIERLNSRNVDKNILNKLSQNINERNKIIQQLNKKQEERNQISSLIAKDKSAEIITKASTIKNEVKELEKQVENYQIELDKLLPYIPNIPLDEVPKGNDEEDNVEVDRHEDLGRGLVKNVQPHYEIGIKKEILDFERAVKISGTRFVIFKNQGAELVRALENFMLDTHKKNGYEEILPPVLVKSDIMFGTGQLPKFENDLFKIKDEDLWLIPTAEVPITNYFNNEIIDLSSCKKITSYTLCFRSEAGSSGKDTKGLIRSRQFNKVEIVKLTTKEDALKEFEQTVKDAESILILLQLPYRKLKLCTGDLGFSSAITYDLEVWIPSEMKFREISSISYFETFQARRAKIRYRDQNNKVQYVHTINGSGLAIDRTIAAILEQYQNEDGSITIPDVLVPYMKNVTKI